MCRETYQSLESSIYCVIGQTKSINISLSLIFPDITEINRFD